MGMRHVNMDCDLSFDTPEDRWRSEQILLYLMTTLTLRNFWFLLDNPDFPKLYDSGMVYLLPEQLERRPKQSQLDDLNHFLAERLGMSRGEIQHHLDLAKGVEIFRDIPRMMENGGGDCLPVETLVGTSKKAVPIGSLCVGDVIEDPLSEWRFATVKKIWPRSMKETITLFLESGAKVVSSLDHRHMNVYMEQVRAEDIRIGDVLATQRALRSGTVRGIERSAPRECIDITTDSGTFKLVESDVITHNCDNWASARAAEIAVAAYRIGAKSNVRPYLVWHEAGDRMIYHAKILHGDGSDEDPSIIMGMGGQAKATERREECRKNWERYDNMWQCAKGMLADETADGEFKSEDARYTRAAELKAAIDSFGYLPKDGVFRVGRPEQQLTGSTKARGLDLLGATVVHGGGGGGHHGGGHRGGGRGGFRQNWGFGGGPAYIIDNSSEPMELDLEIQYDYDVLNAAPAPELTRSLR